MSRKYNISTGKSRFERVWHNEAWTWEELCRRFSSPTVTSETMSEYRAMSREKQTAVKDVGGMVGGYLSQGKRSASSVHVRSLVTLDYDDFDSGHLDALRGTLGAMGTAWLIHSTHKHRDDAWRVRLVVPLSKDISPDEYGAVSRKLAQRIGFDGIDRSTFEPCRLMFWPSRSSDAPYLYEEGKGEPLDPRVILDEYTDWTDMSEWPLLPDEEAATVSGGSARQAFREPGRFGHQEDPLQKKGLVGDFCRAYTVTDAIAKFIPGTYTAGRMRNRYTHTGSKTSGGAWILDDDRFLYSFHGTDPLQGRLLNAWDLVRLVKFGEHDRGKSDDTRQGRLPSTKMMEELATKDPKVRVLLARKREEAAKDFDNIDIPADDDGEERSPEEVRWEEISAELPFKKDGTLPSSSSVVAKVIDGHPKLTGHLRLNRFTGDIDVSGDLPWERNSETWTNTDEVSLRVWLDERFGISAKDKVSDAVRFVSNAHGYHPVRDYLDGLSWDGVERLRHLFSRVLGAEDTELNAELAKLIFKAAVRRIYSPGEKFDYFVILHGPEGCGKSSLFSLMAGKWFSDSVASIEGKDGMEAIQGVWIVEMGELIGVKKSAVESIKSFISRQDDRYRPAYGSVTERHPRQCILVGTTNEDHFLRGLTTGNRRQPVVEIKPEMRREELSVREYVAKWRDQLWAEAVVLHRAGGALMLPDHLSAEVRKVQDEHNLDKTDPLFPEIHRFLDFYLVDGWERMGLTERRNWLKAQNEPEEPGIGKALRDKVTVPEILQEFLEMERTDREYLNRSRIIGQYLNSLKDEWEPIGVRRHKIYGGQKTWKRIDSKDKTATQMTTDVSESRLSWLDDL